MTEYSDPRQFDDPRILSDPRLPSAWDDPLGYERYFDGGVSTPVPGVYPEQYADRYAYQRDVYARIVRQSQESVPVDESRLASAVPASAIPALPNIEVAASLTAAAFIFGIEKGIFDVSQFEEEDATDELLVEAFRLVRLALDYGTIRVEALRVVEFDEETECFSDDEADVVEAAEEIFSRSVLETALELAKEGRRRS
jgi:hypothetical protein